LCIFIGPLDLFFSSGDRETDDCKLIDDTLGSIAPFAKDLTINISSKISQQRNLLLSGPWLKTAANRS